MGNVKVFIQNWVAIMIILVILLGQYAITGFLATSYAIDLLATQSDNVQFRAYFKNGEEELTDIEKSIDAKDIKLKIDVAVKNEGYFNGKISLQDAGFKLGQATANDYIKEIKDNEIILKQINANETATIEVGIEYFEDDKIQASTLSQKTIVKLVGKYTNSVGNVDIDSGNGVKVTWKMPENVKAELAAKIQTNSTYKVNEENKKVVQFLTSSKLTNNAYPVKNTYITATIPTGATNVEVHKRTTKATNGEQEFTSANYNVENNILTININNTEEEGKISWMKNVLDIFVVTYEFPEDADLSTQKITINEKITAQNNSELNAEQVQLSLSEEKDGIASISKQEGETSIYKGKIYTGGRDITSYSIVHVDYIDGVKDIEISEENSKYIKEVEENGTTNKVESDADIDIKTLKINKEKVESVLGNTWNLTIGETTITNESQADSNGDVIIQLPTGTKTITIKTSKPVNNGTFIIETTKRILKTDYTRQQIKEFTKLKDSSSIKYTKNNNDTFTFTSSYNINLKDTESKASLQCEQTALIASAEKQELNLTAVLESRGDNQDLYKNPELKIKLPKQVENVTYKQMPQLMHADNGLELTEGNYKVIEENGQKVLKIKLTGEQTYYLGEAITGTTISIKTEVEIDQTATNSNEEIVMTYTNENATKYTDNGTQKVNIQIVAQSQGGNTGNEGQSGNEGGNTGNQGQNGNEGGNSGSGSQGGSSGSQSVNEQNASLRYAVSAKVGGKVIAEGDTIKAGEIVTYTATITNAGTTDKTGLRIDVKLPENTTLIEINPNYPKYNAETDAYSFEGEEYYNKKTQTNTLKQENISIPVGKVYSYSFMVMANENITEEKNIEAKFTFSENDVNKDEKKLTNKVSPSKLQVICMPLFRKPNDILLSGYNYQYEIKITNLTNEEQKNIKVLLNKNDTINVNSIDWYIEDERQDIIELQNDTLSFETLPANKSIKVVVDAKINAVKENENQLKKTMISAQVSNIEENNYRSNQLEEKIEGVLINVEASSNATTTIEKQGYVKSDDIIKYTFKVKNIGLKDANSLIIKDEFSKYLNLETFKVDGEICEYNKEVLTSGNMIYDKIEIEKELKAKKEIIIEITGKVINDLPDENTNIINRLAVYSDGIKEAETEEINYIVEAQQSEEADDNNGNSGTENEGNTNNSGTDDGNNSGNNTGNNGTETQDGTDNKGTDGNPNIINRNTISGTAWLDSNLNGKRESEENLLNGIKVVLFDIEKSMEVSNTTTDNNGLYYFTNVNSGKYVVIFEYDTSKYALTKYKAEEANSNNNSDVENVTMNIDGKNRRVASTDILNFIEDNIANIDIGLIEVGAFDLSLSKTISSVSVSNAEGNKTVEYDDTNLAKVEIKGKYLKGSVVLVKYKIKVTNNGEVAGYAKKIVDYKPSELKFNSKLNPDWYQSGNMLYTKSLGNNIIEPGETKELTLILTKTMTSSNTGLTNNKAEIVEYFNSQGIANENENQNNDLSQADLIISVSTGIAIKYIIITLLITLLITIIAATIIYLKIRKSAKEFTTI